MKSILHLSSILRLVAASLLLFALLPIQSLQASNECQLYYQYKTSKGATQGKYINLDEGKSTAVGTAGIRYMTNKKNHPVKVKITNLLPPYGTKWVSLASQNAQEPAFGTYTMDVTLYNVSCEEASYSTAAQMISGLKTAGIAINEIAAQVISAFNTSGKDMADMLKDAGYNASSVASALKSALNASGSQAALWLKQAGFTTSQIASAIKSQFNASGSQMSKWLKQAGASVSQVASAIKDGFNASGNQVAGWLKQAGYNAAQAASGLKSAFNANASSVGSWLKASGFSMNDVTKALKSSFNLSASSMVDMLESLYKASYETIKAALEAAGYTASQIAQAMVGMITIQNVMDSFSYGSFASPATSPSQRHIIHPGTHRLTITGAGLVAVTSIVANGVTFNIVGKGGTQDARGNPSGDYMHVEAIVSRNVAVGTRGHATLRVGSYSGPRFNWIVQNPSSRGSRTTPGNTSSRNTTARPDLEPATFTNNLYEVGTATTLDANGDIFTALDPFNNSAFCQGVPQGSTARNNMPTSNRQTITVPDITWGVTNDSNVDINTSFTIKLFQRGRELASQRINSLEARETVSFTYRRPQSTTCVARVGVGGGCYHCGQQREGWNDNDGFIVEVDTGSTVTESSESNNRRAL